MWQMLPPLQRPDNNQNFRVTETWPVSGHYLAFVLRLLQLIRMTIGQTQLEYKCDLVGKLIWVGPPQRSSFVAGDSSLRLGYCLRKLSRIGRVLNHLLAEWIDLDISLSRALASFWVSAPFLGTLERFPSGNVSLLWMGVYISWFIFLKTNIHKI